MLSTLLQNELNIRFISTVIAFIVTVLVTISFYVVFRRKYTQKKQRAKFRSRLTYIAVIVFAFIVIRVWIEGFSHLFTMLSLVGAGLVIVNKETIMNLAGFLIINWRGLFSEGDFIQIQNFTGCVHSIRLLYFKIYETRSLDSPKGTGISIKVPNSLVITAALSTLSMEDNIVLASVSFNCPFDRKPIETAQMARDFAEQLLNEAYKDYAEILSPLVLKRNMPLRKVIDLKPKTTLKMLPDKESNTLQLETSFYCYPEDKRNLEQQLMAKLIQWQSD